MADIVVVMDMLLRIFSVFAVLLGSLGLSAATCPHEGVTKRWSTWTDKVNNRVMALNNIKGAIWALPTIHKGAKVLSCQPRVTVT